MQVRDLFGDLPELATARLILRRITAADAEDRFRFLSDEQVTRFLPFGPHQSIAETEAGILQILGFYDQGQVSPWGIVERSSGRSIGTIGFASWHPRHGRAELYYHLSREFWGQGLTVESAREVIRFGFESMELNRVEAYISPHNPGSLGVARRLGMTSEGVMREVLNIKGEYRDHLIYSLLRREWIK